jgi:hypothetical protein
MATLFKVNKISAALEYQDEADREKVFLMGASEAAGPRRVTSVSVDGPQLNERLGSQARNIR